MTGRRSKMNDCYVPKEATKVGELYACTVDYDCRFKDYSVRLMVEMYDGNTGECVPMSMPLCGLMRLLGE